MESDLLSAYCLERHPERCARNSRCLLDLYPKIAHGSLSPYWTLTLKQLVIPSGQVFPDFVRISYNFYQVTNKLLAFCFYKPLTLSLPQISFRVYLNLCLPKCIS